ncbi:hypothetical protein [Paraburkholderia silvatlantica]|uniref:Uncharacterized protein n=1 Tax=Paraburkholderia silvatlantica TaxID=321895 RepID=A0ABR6FLI0_9BURK|nr:hypothetical protein [Paraburkholderia silvatlantica]MBB2928299.1 hypothetical protein [Paraburkholderia silvatlantica]PVY34654.1 hypothetical protein C7411_107194 [Paraburkholderia silvatlantica]PXW38869.1 hypothetical protein C7413_107194 [Paraburkholderia silvatlantica]
MDRRAFLCDAGAVALGAAWQAHAPGVAFGERVSRANAALAPRAAVYDPALAEGRVLARAAASAGWVAWGVGDGRDDMPDNDIGTLWHARIARSLESGAALIGALRPSDRFVLARLAYGRGVTLRDFA